jgi:hypothetical protein
LVSSGSASTSGSALAGAAAARADRGQPDVKVLGVQHDQQEDEHDADVQQ